MELPVIAELLGVHDPPEVTPAEDEVTTPEEFERRSREILRARVKAAAAGASPRGDAERVRMDE